MSGSVEPRDTWLTLLGVLRALDSLLDEAASDNLLMPIIVGLHPRAGFSNADFDRCLNVLDERARALVSNAIAPFGSCHKVKR